MRVQSNASFIDSIIIVFDDASENKEEFHCCVNVLIQCKYQLKIKETLIRNYFYYTFSFNMSQLTAFLCQANGQSSITKYE